MRTIAMNPVFSIVRTSLFALVVALLVPVAHAQETRTITLDEAVRIALERNVSLRQADNLVEAQASQVTAERGDFLPDLTAFFQTGREYGTTFNQTIGGFTSEQTQSAFGQVTTSVNVFNGFGDVASLSQARHTFDARDYSYDRVQQTVVFDVVGSFLEVIANREQIRIREEDVTSQQQQLEQIGEFVRVGSRPISDQYQQEANAAQAEFELLEAERQLQLSQTRLIQILQLDPFGTYQFIVPELDEDTPLTPESYDLGTLLREAFERRADLKAQEASIDAAEAGIRVARAGYFPTVNFGADVGGFYSSSLTGLDGDTVPFSDQFFDQRRTESLGLNVNIPIFNRFQTQNRVAQAQVQYDNARLDLESQRQDVALQVRQAYLDYQTATKRLDVTAKQLRAAERALMAAQERYEVGATTLVELSQVRASFVQAASNYANARYTFLFQEKLIEYYTGVLDPTAQLTD